MTTDKSVACIGQRVTDGHTCVLISHRITASVGDSNNQTTYASYMRRIANQRRGMMMYRSTVDGKCPYAKSKSSVFTSRLYRYTMKKQNDIVYMTDYSKPKVRFSGRDEFNKRLCYSLHTACRITNALSIRPSYLHVQRLNAYSVRDYWLY